MTTSPSDSDAYVMKLAKGEIRGLKRDLVHYHGALGLIKELRTITENARPSRLRTDILNRLENWK